jgi:nuclear pore complex protein Nup43
MTDTVKINNSYVSEKISKIRFLPEKFDESNKFITGSWDSVTNHLKVWQIATNEDFNEFSPVCLSKLRIHADVTGLEFIGSDHICVSSSDGAVKIYQINHDKDRDNLAEVASFEKLHKHRDGSEAACTGVCLFEENIASVGEDGR